MLPDIFQCNSHASLLAPFFLFASGTAMSFRILVTVETNLTPSKISIMHNTLDLFIQNPGLQHIAHEFFSYLDNPSFAHLQTNNSLNFIFSVSGSALNQHVFMLFWRLSVSLIHFEKRKHQKG